MNSLKNYKCMLCHFTVQECLFYSQPSFGTNLALDLQREKSGNFMKSDSQSVPCPDDPVVLMGAH